MYIARKDDTLYIMTYTLSSGIRGTVPLCNKQIVQWLQCYKENERFLTEIGKEFFGLNPLLVADFKVQNHLSDHQPSLLPIYQRESETLREAYKTTEVLIKIDCKCGTSYVTESPYRRTKWYCTKCKEIVFFDHKKGMIETTRGDAYYMTNKYYVSRE